MPRIQFQNNYYYHIFNRGVDKRKVFCDKKDYSNFLIRLNILNNNSKFEERIYYRNKDKAKKEFNSKALELNSFLGGLPKYTNIIAYCLNPNHYHLLLKQKQENGIPIFMHKIGTGYTNYFNKRYGRSGSLFQGRYKCAPIKTDKQLLYVSAYINGNAEIHKIAKAENWPWSSYQDYLGKRNSDLINKKVILNEFENIKDYQEYTSEVIRDSSGIKEEMRKCILE